MGGGRLRAEKRVSSMLVFTLLILLSASLAKECIENRFGPDCLGECHCMDGPAACNAYNGACVSGVCARGYSGYPFCQIPCTTGLFGLECQYQCRCPVGDVCSPVNGLCGSGRCLYGWGGASCQTRIPVFKVPPNVTHVTSTSLMVTWHRWTAGVDVGDPPIGEYLLEYQQDGETTWTEAVEFAVNRSNEETNVADSEPLTYSYNVTPLSPRTGYRLRLTVARLDNDKLQPSIPGMVSTLIYTACPVPNTFPTDLSYRMYPQENNTITVAIAWKPPLTSTVCGGVKSHIVQITCRELCISSTLVVPAPGALVFISDILPDSKFDIRVFTVSGANLTGPSSPALSVVVPKIQDITTSTHSSTTISSSTKNGNAATGKSFTTLSSTGGISDSTSRTTQVMTTSAPSLEGDQQLANTHAPKDLTVTSRGEQFLSLEWRGPDRTSDRVSYRVVCTLVDSYVTTEGKGFMQQKQTVTDRLVTLPGLTAASLYRLEILAEVGSAQSDKLVRTFWTAPMTPPDPPTPILVEVVNRTAVIQIRSIAIRTGPLTAHQVLVEAIRLSPATVPTIAPDRLRRTTHDLQQPAATPTEVYLNYQNATKAGVSYYVTAQFTEQQVSSDRTFVVGDSKQYGSYYNAPLSEGIDYIIWTSIVSSLDGITKRSFSQVPGEGGTEYTVRIPRAGTDPPVSPVIVKESTFSVGIIIFLVFLIIIVLILTAVAIFIHKRQQRLGKSYTDYFDDCTMPECFNCLGKYRQAHDWNKFQNPQPNKADVVPDPRNKDRVVKVNLNVEQFETPQKKHNYRPDHIKSTDSILNQVNRVKVKDLEQYYNSRELNGYTLKDEFHTLPGGYLAATTVALLPHNANRNRSHHTIPYDRNRVQLPVLRHEQSDYINASLINCSDTEGYIVTQCPLLATAGDFWRMTWHFKVKRIVMLMDLIEVGKNPHHRYWPEHEDGINTYSDVTVRLVSEYHTAHYCVRNFQLTRFECLNTHMVTHFQFHSWSKAGVPIHPIPFVEFFYRLIHHGEKNPGMTVVHDQSGGGRSGIYVATDILCREAQSMRHVDVLRTVSRLRQQRVHLVHTSMQYKYIHLLLIEMCCRPGSCLPRSHVAAKYNELLTTHEVNAKSKLEAEFMLVNATPSQGAELTDAITKSGMRFVSPVKEMAAMRVDLNASMEQLEAIYIDTFHLRSGIVVVQSPWNIGEATFFWDSVIGSGAKAIINLDTSNDKCEQYWPEMGDTEKYGIHSVTYTSLVDEDNIGIAVRQFDVYVDAKDSGDSHVKQRTVLQFHFSCWPPRQSSPLLQSFYSFCERVLSWRKTLSQDVPLLVHSTDTVQRSGLFSVLWTLLERLSVEDDVDILRTVKYTRAAMANVIPNLDQYRFIYRIIREHVKNHDFVNSSSSFV